MRSAAAAADCGVGVPGPVVEGDFVAEAHGYELVF